MPTSDDIIHNPRMQPPMLNNSTALHEPAAKQQSIVDKTGEHWITRYERIILSTVVITVLLASSVPYLYAYLAQPTDRVFVGIVSNVQDNAQYLSWLRDHRSALLVPNRMTPEPNEPLLFNLLWLAVARASSLTTLSVPTVFHIVRISAGTIILLLLYPFCGLFTRSKAEQLSAYLMIALGAGLGWIWVVEKYWFSLPGVRYPLDLYVAEPNLFLNVMAFPHFVIAALLIVAILWCFLTALRRRSWAYAWLAAGVGLLLTLQHAYDLLIIGLIPAGTLGLMLLRDRRIPWFGVRVLALLGLIATPPAAYFTLLTTTSPLWRQVLAQFANAGVYTPPPHHLFVLMGVPLIIAFIGVCWGLFAILRSMPGSVGGIHSVLASADTTDLLLWSWLIIGFFLLYVPTDFQIHMLNSWQIPVALIAARTLYRRLLPQLAQKQHLLERAIPLLVVLLVIPTNLYLTAWRVYDLGRFEAPYFLTRGEDNALAWLEQQATGNTVVLSGLQLGQFVPVRSDARTFLGHWAQTVDYYEKERQVQSFFDGATSDDTRLTLLDRFDVTYVIYGREERSFGSFAPERAPFLEPVYNSDGISIYRVYTE